ncbi:hypothetical protein [Haloactinomyces albus]|uniref:Uncharacterized protein n=1 Tax=Haloactinomyces albus TaxID=1352928 RepID=A0AAE4CSC8_9ACTN|nr:hypothetical protein [Haloactinomyces albus]MDR7304558.1 hypothetical protein [Haloactinomyces albus]
MNDLLLIAKSMFSIPMLNSRMPRVFYHANGSPTSGSRSRTNGRFWPMSGKNGFAQSFAGATNGVVAKTGRNSEYQPITARLAADFQGFSTRGGET